MLEMLSLGLCCEFVALVKELGRCGLTFASPGCWSCCLFVVVVVHRALSGSKPIPQKVCPSIDPMSEGRGATRTERLA